jgi:hypothetical protein
LAYLVLPVLHVVSQYTSRQIIQSSQVFHVGFFLHVQLNFGFFLALLLMLSLNMQTQWNKHTVRI